MNQKHHVSLSIAKQLVEAGIVIESKFWWHFKIDELGNRCYGKLVHFPSNTSANDYPAPLATEILERLPENVTIISHINDGRLIGGNMAVHGDVRVLNNSLPDALALLLIRLTKDGLI